MPIIWDIKSCAEVTDEDIATALEEPRSKADRSPEARVLALLEKMGEVAAAGDDARRILVVLARFAESPWLHGVLEIRVKSQPAGVTLEILLDQDGELRRLHRGLVVHAPYEDFAAAIAADVKRFAPLQLKPSLDAGLLRLLARAGTPSGSFLIPTRRSPTANEIQKTVRRAIVVPTDARPAPVAPPKEEPKTRKIDELDAVDDGWDPTSLRRQTPNESEGEVLRTTSREIIGRHHDQRRLLRVHGVIG